jgi:two-component system alkaline phosphatase synthesis response regulator PhoP
MNRKVLVVDDDEKICELLTDILREDGLKVSVAHTTEDAWIKVTEVNPDVILLDVEIPLKGGLEFCRQLKGTKTYQQIPILFLTVRGRDMDKVAAFNYGGDDFITKPFSQRELLARVQAALKRASLLRMLSTTLRSGSLLIDFDRRLVLIKNKEVDLSPKEFDILKLLYMNRNRVLSDREIFDQVWGVNSSSMMSTVYTHINRLRKKMKMHAAKIKTISGVGFRFDERQRDGKR